MKAGVNDYYVTDLFSFIFMSCTQNTLEGLQVAWCSVAEVSRYISKLQIILQLRVKEDTGKHNLLQQRFPT